MHGTINRWLPALCLSTLTLLSVFFVNRHCLAADQPPTGPDAGNVFILSASPDNTIRFQLGGIFDTDYRFYAENERADNRFFVRRAQMELSAWLRPWLKLNFEYELKSDVIDHLMDTYAQVSFGNHALKVGHFKKPFSLEYQNGVESVYFAERSMGKFLSPGRDVGAMLSGSVFDGTLHYAMGLFNAEGDDIENRGDGEDMPEAAGRIVFTPFAGSQNAFLKYFQIGASGTYTKINLGNLSVKVKTTGMVDTSRNIYVLSHDTKFGVLQEADDRLRIGAEAAWAWKSFACQTEYISLSYSSLKPVGRPRQDADLYSYYVSMLYFPTGETPAYENGVMTRINPLRPFDLSAKTYGALGIGLRYDHFEGDADWINPAANVSVEKADSVSLALNWILLPMHRIILDYTYTDLSDPIRVRINRDGTVEFIEKENAVTLRYSLDF
jgi:phosphate-selective porin